MTPVRHHHLSRHHGLSPSNSQSPFQLDLLSPSSSSSHSTVLQAQQQQQTEMSFTSAFTSTLRNRRGKTLILPKLKIPRSSNKVDGGLPDETETGGGMREIQSSSIHHWQRHSENTTTHFRRSVSSSTFTESAAWYSSRQSSTSNMSEVISGSSWVKTPSLPNLLDKSGWAESVIAQHLLFFPSPFWPSTPPNQSIHLSVYASDHQSIHHLFIFNQFFFWLFGFWLKMPTLPAIVVKTGRCRSIDQWLLLLLWACLVSYVFFTTTTTTLSFILNGDGSCPTRIPSDKSERTPRVLFF